MLVRRAAVLRSALLCAAALCRPALAADDGPSLEDLLQREVVGPSRYAQSLVDAPAVVSILGQREAELLGHSTIADMLNRMPGIYFSQSRQYISVGMRGLNRPGDYNARLLMSIDGFRVNDALYDQALPEYEFPLVAEWVKRLELVHGPSSSVYGGNALMGVVNLVTLDGADAPGLRLKASTGSFQTGRLMLQYGNADVAGGDLFVGANLYRSGGENLSLPEIDAGPMALHGLDGTSYASLFAKYRLGAWRATLSAMQRDKDVATAPYGTLAGVPGTRYVDRYAYAELAYDEGWQDELRRSLRLGLARSEFDGRYVYEDGLINRDLAHAGWLSVDARAQWRGWFNHDLMLGLDARIVPAGVQRNFDEQPYASVLDSRESTRSLGLYAQDQWQLSEAWRLTAGLRLDSVDGHAPEWSPRLAAVYHLSAQDTLKLMVSRAFRAANLAERFYADGVSQLPNPGLKPERMHTAELAWERALDARTALTANAYLTRMSSMIEIVPTEVSDVGRYENLSSVLTRGLDLGVEHHEAGGIDWRVDLSLMSTRSAGQRLSNSPSWLLKGHLIAPLAAGWSLGVEAQGVGTRTGLLAPVPAYATANALLRFTGWRDQVVALRLRNLADRAYADPAGPESAPLSRIPQARRSIQLDWQIRF